MSATELIDLLEKTTGPDREVDGQLFLAFIGSPNAALLDMPPSKMQWEYECAGKWVALAIDGHPFRVTFNVLEYSASLDAALELFARVLPGWFVYHLGERVKPIIYAGDTHENTGEGFRAELQIRSGGRLATAHAPTPALAILLAMVRAKALLNS